MSRQTVGCWCLALPPALGSHQKALIQNLRCPSLWSHCSNYGHHSGCMLNSSQDRHPIAYFSTFMTGQKGLQAGCESWTLQMKSPQLLPNPQFVLHTATKFWLWDSCLFWDVVCVWVIHALPALLYRHSLAFWWWFSFTDICCQIKAFWSRALSSSY